MGNASFLPCRELLLKHNIFKHFSSINLAVHSKYKQWCLNMVFLLHSLFCIRCKRQYCVHVAKFWQQGGCHGGPFKRRVGNASLKIYPSLVKAEPTSDTCSAPVEIHSRKGARLCRVDRGWGQIARGRAREITLQASVVTGEEGRRAPSTETETPLQPVKKIMLKPIVDHGEADTCSDRELLAGTAIHGRDPSWSSMFLKNCTPQKASTLQSFLKNCNSLGGPTIEELV